MHMLNFLDTFSMGVTGVFWMKGPDAKRKSDFRAFDTIHNLLNRFIGYTESYWIDSKG